MTVKARGGAVVGLAWVATAVVGMTALVSLILSWRMDELFDAAVAEGRAFPYTGEAGEQGIFPALLACLGAVITIATATLAYVLRGWAMEGLHAGWTALNIVLVVLLAAGVPLALPVWDFIDRQYSHDLYGWWYFPFLIGSAVIFAGCLIGVTTMLIRRDARP